MIPFPAWRKSGRGRKNAWIDVSVSIFEMFAVTSKTGNGNVRSMFQRKMSVDVLFRDDTNE